MTNDCSKWKDHLLETALTGKAAAGLEEHLRNCSGCAQELAALQARRERMDALLPLVAQGAETPPDFRARVLAAAESAAETKAERSWRVMALVGALAVMAIALVIGFAQHRRTVRTAAQTELAAAEKLAEWRAPSDVLLQTPGHDILQTLPTLGDSYVHLPVQMPTKRSEKAVEEN